MPNLVLHSTVAKWQSLLDPSHLSENLQENQICKSPRSAKICTYSLPPGSCSFWFQIGMSRKKWKRSRRWAGIVRGEREGDGQRIAWQLSSLESLGFLSRTSVLHLAWHLGSCSRVLAHLRVVAGRHLGDCYSNTYQDNISLFCLQCFFRCDSIASPSTYPGQWVSESVSYW